ncbi:hypothetical protein [Streptomyces sp. HNM0574]|uniref:hypothetical protein n=1 Tax=Streptomyces sp. HNM0574 TaxID=2714954 RepID=UPI00146C2D4A|nr:hypothetical protein [Streptomyces sp. HNM0574]NLU68433.1 hypothetical protein [Streptomyces sp. HNM0574]
MITDPPGDPRARVPSHVPHARAPHSGDRRRAHRDGRPRRGHGRTRAGTLADEEFYAVAVADAETEKYLTLLAQVPDEFLDQGGPAVQTWLDE